MKIYKGMIPCTRLMAVSGLMRASKANKEQNYNKDVPMPTEFNLLQIKVACSVAIGEHLN